jgi:hypothetical protein
MPGLVAGHPRARASRQSRCRSRHAPRLAAVRTEPLVASGRTRREETPDLTKVHSRGSYRCRAPRMVLAAGHSSLRVEPPSRASHVFAVASVSHRPAGLTRSQRVSEVTLEVIASWMIDSNLWVLPFSSMNVTNTLYQCHILWLGCYDDDLHNSRGHHSRYWLSANTTCCDAFIHPRQRLSTQRMMADDSESIT